MIMKVPRLTPELAEVARRCVWFKSPKEAIRQPTHLVAHILTYGLHEDVKVLRHQLSDDDLRAALAKAPPGVFDARSWVYWHLVLGEETAPPLPRRTLPEAPISPAAEVGSDPRAPARRRQRGPRRRS